MAYFIEVRNNNVEKALRVLKKKLMKDGVMKEIKDRAHFIKPSMKKREKQEKSLLEDIKKKTKLKR